MVKKYVWTETGMDDISNGLATPYQKLFVSDTDYLKVVEQRNALLVMAALAEQYHEEGCTCSFCKSVNAFHAEFCSPTTHR